MVHVAIVASDIQIQVSKFSDLLIPCEVPVSRIIQINHSVRVRLAELGPQMGLNDYG